MSRKNHRGPKLTLKAAKAIAEQELGKSTGLTANENNCADFQSYEIRLGKYTAVISSILRYPGLAFFSLAGVYTYYDIKTISENYVITDKARRKSQREELRDMAASDSRYMLKTLIDEHGLESCHRMLDEV